MSFVEFMPLSLSVQIRVRISSFSLPQRRGKSNRIVRHRKVSQRDKHAVTWLLKDTERLLNQFSEDQRERTLSADRHKQAEALLKIKDKRQMEKSL